MNNKENDMENEVRIENPNPLNDFFLPSRRCDNIPDCDDFTDEKGKCSDQEFWKFLL